LMHIVFIYDPAIVQELDTKRAEKGWEEENSVPKADERLMHSLRVWEAGLATGWWHTIESSYSNTTAKETRHAHDVTHW